MRQALSGGAIADAFRIHPHLDVGRALARTSPGRTPSSWSSFRPYVAFHLDRPCGPPSPAHCISATIVLPETLKVLNVQSPSARFLTICWAPFSRPCSAVMQIVFACAARPTSSCASVPSARPGMPRHVEFEHLQPSAVLARPRLTMVGGFGGDFLGRDLAIAVGIGIACRRKRPAGSPRQAAGCEWCASNFPLFEAARGRGMARRLSGSAPRCQRLRLRRQVRGADSGTLNPSRYVEAMARPDIQTVSTAKANICALLQPRPRSARRSCPRRAVRLLVSAEEAQHPRQRRVPRIAGSPASVEPPGRGFISPAVPGLRVSAPSTSWQTGPRVCVRAAWSIGRSRCGSILVHASRSATSSRGLSAHLPTARRQRPFGAQARSSLPPEIAGSRASGACPNTGLARHLATVLRGPGRHRRRGPAYAASHPAARAREPLPACIYQPPPLAAFR